MDDVGNFMKRFTTKATASHILIKGGAEAENQLEDLKAEIGDSPVKFAEYAAKYSACPRAIPMQTTNICVPPIETD